MLINNNLESQFIFPLFLESINQPSNQLNNKEKGVLALPSQTSVSKRPFVIKNYACKINLIQRQSGRCSNYSGLYSSRAGIIGKKIKKYNTTA